MNDRAHVSDQPAPPVFVPTDAERLESLAVTGRGPLRLAAAAILAADLRRSARQSRRAARLPAPAASPITDPVPLRGGDSRGAADPPARPRRRPPASAARAVPAAAPAPKAAAPARSHAAATPITAAPPPARRSAGAPPANPAAGGTAQRRDRAMTPARLQRARTDHQAKLLSAPPDPVQVVADDRAWERWASWSPGPDEHEGFERLDSRRLGGRLSLRRRRSTPARSSAGPSSGRKAPLAALPTNGGVRAGAGTSRRRVPAAAPPPAGGPKRAAATRKADEQRSARVRAGAVRRPTAVAAPSPAAAAAKASWRARAGAALDRLAEQEVARGARLEARLIPPIGRSDRT